MLIYLTFLLCYILQTVNYKKLQVMKKDEKKKEAEEKEMKLKLGLKVRIERERSWLLLLSLFGGAKWSNIFNYCKHCFCR